MIKTRNGDIIVTNENQNKLLKKLYGSVLGRVLLKTLTAPVISRAAGIFMDSKASKLLIKPFIKRSGIDTSQYIMRDFRSYNDFFTRRVIPEKRPVDYEPSHLISPCDSKLTVHKISKNSIFRIKGSRYRVSDLLKNDFLAKRFCGGYCLIFRLEVDDYHRYCYIDNGTKTENTYIAGELHTVNPIALERYNIYKRNCREYTVLHTENFGDVVQVEVGAMMVGRIVNNDDTASFLRGEEKGRFEFGGSTIVMLFGKDSVRIDEDILRNSAEDIETVVKYGEKIGKTGE
ncbi:phosphatidylserine decarboxylase [Ruminococcus flavefaciens]|uniref:phosphatidylserine decarboxylase n=1 Tax=Ruminococcus flavefaciens TaxID=1265 RepID=UPI0026EAC721|nr:phosphatidylserine decarboxylase [Ruminococcus flavefaciens]MDD7517015.1 phosphatidylserine decarboxylase [Ruminococcus flavefaciens]MDY5692372.1 phosphatidylserine decarboxylase [Ruminococcus flavefaciens]